MVWLERPAGVYTRHEVVLHCIDNPHPVHATNPVTGREVAYDAWELRALFVFDAQAGRWELASARPFGYRRGVRNGPRVEIPSTTPELRRLAARYLPAWIPDPSKPRLHLPAEDVFDEAIALATQKTNRTLAVEIDNPYRGE
jgi:hypothetical protein